MRDIESETIKAVCDEIRSRQRFLRAPKRIGDAVNDLIARNGYARVQSAAGCEAAWRQVVGEHMARHSRVGNVRRGQLEITVSNSAIVQELTFVSKRLVKQLAELVPDQKIRGLRFRVGKIEERKS